MYTQKKHKMTRLYHSFLAQEQYTQGINEGKNLCGMFLECNIYILISTSFFSHLTSLLWLKKCIQLGKVKKKFFFYSLEQIMQVVYNLRSTIVMGRLLLLIKHVFCLQDKIHISIIHPRSLHSLLPLSFTETSYRSQTQFISRSEIKKKEKKILMCIVNSSTTYLYQF